MKICHISTFWPNRFGLTHYTDLVIRAIRANRAEQHLVLGGALTDSAETEAYRCIPCWNLDQDYVEPIVANAVAQRADVAVIQYTNDIFGDDDRIVRLLGGLRARRIKSVAFYHSVYPARRSTAYRPGGTSGHLDRAVGAAADCIIVHTETMRRDLVGHGVDPAKVAVIPHGTEILAPPDREASRARLGLPREARVVLFFGFIWLGKGLDFLFDVFARVARRLSDAYLYVGGYTRHKKLYTRAYMQYLRARQWRLGIARRTLTWGDYVPDEMVSTMYSAADVVAFPYRQDYSSASGVLHQAVGFGRLPLCSRIAKFDEVEAISPRLLVGAKDLRGWSDRLVELLTNTDEAERLREQVCAFAERTSWERVGRMHLRLYQGLLAGEDPGAVELRLPGDDAP